MRNFRLFTFIKDGFKGVFRNGLMSVASILVLLSSLLVTGIFLTLVLNVNFNLEKLDNFNEVVCYLKLDSNAEQVEETKDEIQRLDNVQSVTYVSKKEALESEREKYGDQYSYLFDSYDDETNPLPTLSE